MVMEVLQSESEIGTARAELFRRGLSSLESYRQRILRTLRLTRSIKVGDEIKAWDVLKTIQFIEQHLSRDASILDIGAFASEILLALHRLGYSRLAGVDLNPSVKKMPHADVIRYEISDFMETPFEAASFDAITSISVIEHGFQSRRLLKEISRLLRKDGFFVASFDYWPDKIDTVDTKFFGMDWMIFSKEDVSTFIEEARGYGLAPAGPVAMHASERPIKCGGRQYTFGWLVLKKVA